MSPRVPVLVPARRLVVVALVAMAVSACGGSADDDSAVRGALAEPGAGEPADGEVAAFTYDTTAAPVGARLSADIDSGADSTSIDFEMSGMQPDRGYAVHAHVDPCGADGMAAGPHFQNEQDPAATPDAPSSDPAYANAENEFWLDLTTDAEGAGSADTEVPFGITDRRPQSIIVHEAMMTATGAGEAGTAGGRVACLDLPMR